MAAATNEEKLISFHTPDNLWRAIKLEAITKGMSVKDAARKAFEHWLINEGSDAALEIAKLRPKDFEEPEESNPLAAELREVEDQGLEENLDEYSREQEFADERYRFEDIPNGEEESGELRHGDDLIVEDDD